MAMHVGPDSTTLLNMIARAERAFEADRQHEEMKKEARELARAERAWNAEATAKRYRRMLGNG